MPCLDTIAAETIALLEKKHLSRRIAPVERLSGARVLRDGKELVSFASNDYFGLARHPHVVEAACAAIKHYGAGAGASRLAGGSHSLYTRLEAQLAAYKNKEAALVFGSGYLANLGVIPALVGAGDLIIADKLVHACMLDAARISGASVMRFAHNNVEHCAALLADARSDYARCLILTETIFSMDGDLGPVKALKALAGQHDAWLMVDDAHGLGMTDVSKYADIIIGTLSKGLGAYGGYVCASEAVVQWLTNNARSLVFSTGLPPAVVASASSALEVLEQEKALAERPVQLAKQFAETLGMETPSSAIVPLMLGEAEKALKAAAYLEESGFYVPAIRPPTVPPGTARLRVAFTAEHTENDMIVLAAAYTRGGCI